MIVAFTDEAEADLERIGDFIARDNPRRAATFVAELIACCHQLADAPEGYPLVPRYHRSGVRRRVFGTYLIFYRVGRDRIDVLRILSSAQDYEVILSRED